MFSSESSRENSDILNDIDSSIHASKLFMRRLAENTTQGLLKFRPQGSLWLLEFRTWPRVWGTSRILGISSGKAVGSRSPPGQDSGGQPYFKVLGMKSIGTLP
jgi:hypothetical protein